MVAAWTPVHSAWGLYTPQSFDDRTHCLKKEWIDPPPCPGGAGASVQDRNVYSPTQHCNIIQNKWSVRHHCSLTMAVKLWIRWEEWGHSPHGVRTMETNGHCAQLENPESWIHGTKEQAGRIDISRHCKGIRQQAEERTDRTAALCLIHTSPA